MRPYSLGCQIEAYKQELGMSLEEAKASPHPRLAKARLALIKPFEIIFDYFRNDPSLIVIFALWFALVSSEVWVPYLIGVITQDAYWFGIGSACWLFWAGPGTPFLAIVLALTIVTKAAFDKIRRKI